MSASSQDRSFHATEVVLAVLLVFAGVTVVGTLMYTEATTDLESDYAAYSQSCDSLEGQANLEEDGIGVDAETLNETHVQQCRNTSFADYRASRHRSMQTTPLNLKQWGWYGGAAAFLLVSGGALLWRQRG